MPVDTSLYGNIQPPKPFNGLEALGQIMQLRDQQAYRRQQIDTAQALEDERRQKLQEAQRQQQNQNLLADAYKQSYDPQTGKVDRNRFGAILTQSGLGHALPDIYKGLDEAEAAATKARQAKTDLEKSELEYAATMAKHVVASDFNPMIVQGVLTAAELEGHDVSQFQQLYAQQPDQFKTFVMNLANPPKAAAPFSLGPGQVQFDANGKEIARVAPTTPPKADYTIGNVRFSGQTNQPIATGPESATQQNYSGTQGDAEDIAQAIIRGEQPPDLTAMYRLGGPVRAALGRAKYDLTKAQEDWTATKKYLQTLNGAQQVRLRQAVDFTKESLNSVRALAEQWNAPTFGPLSKARLVLAKSGSLGQPAKELATKIDAQIADVVSELATVYKGGNSSTDESLKLAAKNLSSEWDAKTMLANLAQIDQNLGYRQNSMKTAGVASIQGENAYAPTASVPASPLPPVSERVPGKTHATINGIDRVWNGTGWALP